MQRLIKFKKQLRTGALNVFAENFRTKKSADNRMRALTEKEIEILKQNGNHSDDWSLLRVDTGFTPERIFRSVFIGKVSLPAFYGTLLLPGDVSFPTGIYDSVLHNCEVENALIHRVSMLSNVFISMGVVLHHVGTLVSSGKILLPSSLSIGNECGGRKLRIFPEITPEFLDFQLQPEKESEINREFSLLHEEWAKDFRLPCGVVGQGAVVSGVGVIRNSWIGAHARIEGASKIRNSVILSSLEETTGIYDGVILENSIVQESATIHSSAQVKDSLLCKKVTVGKNALVQSSAILFCSHIDEAEVTSSFLGPLSSLHHHSLLISALWPGGLGNVAYGANIGSNHTGRMPDQEIHPGQGIFFGLGVNIKFPANLRESPFSLFSTGITTFPQRLQMPFSLINRGFPLKYGLNENLNEIVPGWMFAKNPCALARNFYKYALRGKGYVKAPTLFALPIVKSVARALSELRALPIKEVYTAIDLESLGSNYLSEPNRQFAMKAYRDYLEQYVLTSAILLIENDLSLANLPLKDLIKPLPGENFKDKWDWTKLPATFPEIIKRYKQTQKEYYEGILAGLARDKARGRKIFDDYDSVHPDDSDFLNFVKNQYEENIRRANALQTSILQREKQDDSP